MSSISKNKILLNRSEAALKKHLSLQEVSGILRELEILIAVNPEHVRALTIYARYQLKNLRPDLAGEASSRIINFDINNIEAQSILLKCYALIGDNKRAYQSAKTLKLSKVKDIETLELMGSTMVFNEEYRLALDVFKKLAAIQPTISSHLTNLGAVLHYCNEVKAAESFLLKACKINPLDYRSYWLLSQLRTVSQESNHINLIEKQLAKPIPENEGTIFLHFALAKELEDLKIYDESFNNLKKANDGKLKYLSQNSALDFQEFSIIRSQYMEIKEKSISGFESNEPIFIVGMPRSGTTLVQQVLGAHPDIYIAGELNDFFRAMCLQSGSNGRRLPIKEVAKKISQFNFNSLGRSYLELTRPRTGKTTFFIDKMPSNFLHLGAIHKALPNAKFIHITRHPIDVCLSNFKTLFGAGMYPHSYNMETIATYFCHYQKLMHFWQECFGESIVTISYESLVNNPSQQFESIFTHCGVIWKNEYLSYYKSNTPVGTASAAQVRGPIYHSSIEKWRHFEPFIGIMISKLKSLGAL